MSQDIHPQPQSQLSALMDGEVDEFELRRTIELLGEDSELRAKWRRYQVAASALRGESGHWQVDLSARIAAAVAAEPAPRRRLLTGVLGRAAVAASVAALTIVGVRYWLPFDPAEPEIAGSAALAQGAVAPPYRPMVERPLGIQLPAVQTVAATDAMALPIEGQERVAPPLSAAQEAQIRRYVEERMLRHADATASHEGLLPVARLPRRVDDR